MSQTLNINVKLQHNGANLPCICMIKLCMEEILNFKYLEAFLFSRKDFYRKSSQKYTLHINFHKLSDMQQAIYKNSSTHSQTINTHSYMCRHQLRYEHIKIDCDRQTSSYRNIFKIFVALSLKIKTKYQLDKKYKIIHCYLKSPKFLKTYGILW